MMKFAIVFLFCALFFVERSAAQDIIINDYAAVQSYDPCQNRIVVDTADNFHIGDTILIIQMKGAVVDSSNSAAFGDVLVYNNAGNYEMNTISAKNGNILTLNYVLQRSYDIPAGKVQIVRIPFFQNYGVDQQHSALPWTGTKGGVFVINVANTLTVNSTIDVSGKGFRGGFGGPLSSGVLACDVTDYYVVSNFDSAARKGEGIAELSGAKSLGRGKLANGGGGGNAHNAGGGGGGNGNTGGIGGFQFDGCAGAPLVNTTGGVGGIQLNYSNPVNKIFLGGGGGAGHSNTQTITSGGNGGGIIIVNAGTITGNNGNILANGQDAPQCTFVGGTDCHDGMGGGGGAGVVLLNANSITGSISSNARGGAGANENGPAANGKVGPGAGGSGGVVWLKMNATPPSVTPSVSGGVSGVVTFNGNAWGAAPGQPGKVMHDLLFDFPTNLFNGNAINLDFTDSLLSCLTRQFINLSTSTVSISSWTWKFGDGGTSNLKDPAHTYPTGGTYDVTLIALDSLGCSDSVTKQVVLDTMNYAVTDTNVACKTVQLLATYVGGKTATSFTWLFGDGDTASGNPVTHFYPVGGSYTVSVITEDSLGCIDTFTHGVAITDFLAGISVPDDTICQGGTITFTNASSNSANVYAWNFDDGSAEDSTLGAIHTFPNSGVYNVRLIVANAELCVDTAFQTIIVDSVAALEFFLTDSSLCEGIGVVFNAAYPDDSTFRSIVWNFGDGHTIADVTTATHSFDTTGVYTVSATATFRRCPNAGVSHDLTIRPFPKLNLGPDTSLCPGGRSVLIRDDINASNPAAHWIWNTGDSASRIFARHPGIYTARVEVDGCSTDDSVEVFKDCYIDVPNAFTPNGDGNNDYFFPRQLLSSSVLSFRMSIFNRWGQVIFETSKADGRGWDGKFNSEDQPQGVFVYLIDVVFKNGATEKYQGNVTLLR